MNAFWFYKLCHRRNVNWAIYCRTSLSRWTAATVACSPASFRSTWAGMSHTVWQENETLTLKVKMSSSLKPPLNMFRWHPSITVSQKYRNYACSLHALKIPFFPGESGFLSLRQTCLSSGSVLQTSSVLNIIFVSCLYCPGGEWFSRLWRTTYCTHRLGGAVIVPSSVGYSLSDLIPSIICTLVK